MLYVLSLITVSFRGALLREPGIHNHWPRVMDSGLATLRWRPGMTQPLFCSGGVGRNGAANCVCLVRGTAEYPSLFRPSARGTMFVAYPLTPERYLARAAIASASEQQILLHR